MCIRDRSPAVLAHLRDAPAWHNFTRHDNLLYEAVNESLDKTVEGLGKQRVETLVEELRDALRIVQEECAATTVFPCSRGGTFQPINDCLLWDSGCGHECIDRVVRERGL